MTKLEETNDMIKAASRLYSIPMEPYAIVDKNDVLAITLLDIARSLAIIADGITAQNEKIEKIESDLYGLYRIERKVNSMKSVK
jgi:hypothetical protein